MCPGCICSARPAHPTMVAMQSTSSLRLVPPRAASLLPPAGVLGALAAVSVIGGWTSFVIPRALRVFPPLLLAGLRLSIAGALLYGLARHVAGTPAPTRAEWL